MRTNIDKINPTNEIVHPIQESHLSSIGLERLCDTSRISAKFVR